MVLYVFHARGRRESPGVFLVTPRPPGAGILFKWEMLAWEKYEALHLSRRESVECCLEGSLYHAQSQIGIPRESSSEGFIQINISCQDWGMVTGKSTSVNCCRTYSQPQPANPTILFISAREQEECLLREPYYRVPKTAAVPHRKRLPQSGQTFREPGN